VGVAAAAQPASELRVAVVSSLTNVFPRGTLDGSRSARLTAARGEWEAFQVVVRGPARNVRAAAEPFDELACQALMRAHAAAGNRAEALRVYSKCSTLFRDELGATPSPQTEAVFLRILRAAE